MGICSVWLDKYEFDEQVLIALFDYCFNKAALHKNYVQAVAEAWGLNKIKNLNDWNKGYDEGFDFWLKGDELRKNRNSIKFR